MTPAEEFASFESQEQRPIPVAPSPPVPDSRQPILSFRRVVPPVDTIDLGGELHVIKPLMLLPLEVQTAVINDRNAQLALQRRVEAHEALTDEEGELLPFYLARIVRTAIPTCPDWIFNAPDDETEPGLLPEQHESICTFFFARSQELRDLLGATVVRPPRPISPSSSPGSNGSTAATPAAGSVSQVSGSTSSSPRSRPSKRANNS